MTRFGILGAMQLETDILKGELQEPQEFNHAGFDFKLGKIYGLEVVVVTSGIGKVNAAACTQLLADRFNCQYIINTGIAGGLNEELEPLDVVISSDTTPYDVRPGQLENTFPFTRFFLAHDTLIDLARRACEGHPQLAGRFSVGRVTSGESFIADARRKEEIRQQLQAHCVEMEGAAVGHVASINNTPFVIIRTISDKADGNATMSYQEFEELAAHRSAEIVLSMLKLFGDKGN